MVVAMESMLMVEATIDMETSFLEDIMVMEISLLKDIKELKEISNEDSSDNMNENSIEQEECVETKEKDKVEETERLCTFDSISILSKESEYFECLKEKEYELEKSESTKKNECFIEKQQYRRRAKRKRGFQREMWPILGFSKFMPAFSHLSCEMMKFDIHQEELRIQTEGLEEFTRLPRQLKVLRSSTESN
ncbi:hypothetical protein M9H77_07183 [Catharanthus roseus]|uniref:Uncharacterized protein n=1 Tax=Catharanthus roseus TaxID=4058 RepID=A0ACC0BUH2_CATRO|nr:hypothetical protein M9H77_07183 [Catharanthus roseus]